MQKGLVTVLTPLYNLETLVSRLLESVLMQTYPHVEMIVMNDGSTDNGVEVVKSYKDKFQARGYSLMLINQENQGLSATIKNGLEHVHGEYLVWPDADDFYHSPDTFTEMVKVLEESDNTIGMVRCRVNMVNEEDINTVVHVTGAANKPIEDKSLFTDCLFCTNNYYYGAGAYMIKYQAYLHSSKGFYTNRTNGQNLQLCLPVLYHYLCASLPVAYITYLIRGSSHSHHARSYEKEIETIKTHENTRLETLKNIKGMPHDELISLSKIVIRNSLISQYYMAYKHQNKDEVKRINSQLKEYGGIPLRDKIKLHWKEIPLIPQIYRLLKG